MWVCAEGRNEGLVILSPGTAASVMLVRHFASQVAVEGNIFCPNILHVVDCGAAAAARERVVVKLLRYRSPQGGSPALRRFASDGDGSTRMALFLWILL